MILLLLKVFLRFHLNMTFLESLVVLVFPNLRNFPQPKLQFKSSECTFLGYSLNHKEYKCLSPKGKVIISRNVVFNELSFPFAKKSSNACQSTIVSPNEPILRLLFRLMIKLLMFLLNLSLVLDSIFFATNLEGVSSIGVSSIAV